jgi:AraC-like DNA-binding protein
MRERTRDFAAKRFGLELHFGESSDLSSGGLSARYSEALGAAERAASEDVPTLRAEPGETGTVSVVRQLRGDLSRAAEERPKALAPTFERYIDAVVARSGYRVDLVRVHLEAGFDLAARALLSPGALSERSYVDLCSALERTARDASTLSDLLAAYRLAISNLLEFAERPVQAAQHGNLQRAVRHIQANLGEPLRLGDVARVAGFATSHFAKLFRDREGMTFGRYVKVARIERAKELLQGTDLSADRVSQLSGFALRHYFHRVFKAVVGMTPMQYRKARPKSRRRP